MTKRAYRESIPVISLQYYCMSRVHCNKKMANAYTELDYWKREVRGKLSCVHTRGNVVTKNQKDNFKQLWPKKAAGNSKLGPKMQARRRLLINI